MLETVVLIAIPVIAFLLTVPYVIREERKARRWRQMMFEECKGCQLSDEGNRMSDFTDEDAVTAMRMVADGATWDDVVARLYPDSEYPDVLAELTCARTKWWYKHQTKERIRELMEDG